MSGGLKFFRNDVMNSVHEKQKRLDGREVCKAIHQRLGTLVTNLIGDEVKLLDGREEG